MKGQTKGYHATIAHLAEAYPGGVSHKIVALVIFIYDKPVGQINADYDRALKKKKEVGE